MKAKINLSAPQQHKAKAGSAGKEAGPSGKSLKSADGPSNGKKRRANKGEASEDEKATRARKESEDDEATRARKELQRAKQKEALALRAAGQTYTPAKRRRKPKERRKWEERSNAKLIEKRELGKKLRKEKKTAPDVVIIPIFWKGQAGQRGKVLSVCSDIQKYLVEAGKRVELDAGHKYTPGQKFAHWEHRGVLLRVEIGPREAERSCCTVARTFKPGEPALRAEGVKVETEALLQEIRRLAAMTEEERDVAAQHATEYKAHTHNGQIFLPSEDSDLKTKTSDAQGAANKPPAPKKAKVVKF